MKAVFGPVSSTVKPEMSLPGAKSSGDIVAVVLRVANPDCACEKARKYDGKTYEIADAPKLPFIDCGRVDCRCRFERIADRRRGERRVHADRREGFRFEVKDDRRKTERRKGRSAWRGSGV